MTRAPIEKNEPSELRVPSGASRAEICESTVLIEQSPAVLDESTA